MDTLLIIADPEDQRQVALTRGLALARAMGARVEVVAFVFEYLKAIAVELKDQEKFKARLIQHRQDWLKHTIEEANCEGLELTQQIIWEKELHPWINQRCKQQDYFAVVKTGHRTQTFFHTPTDWHLMRECPAPVLLVTEKKWRRARPILAALDLSTEKPAKQKLNTRILDMAERYAKALGRELHVVHALHISTLLKDLDLIDAYSHERKRKQALKPVTDQLMQDYQLEERQIHLCQGPAHKIIPSVANDIKADLVVMGTAGQAGLAGRLIGNIAEKVLLHLHTDVLTLKPED